MMMKCHQHRLFIKIVHVATKIDIEPQDRYQIILRKFITSQNKLNLAQCRSAIEKGKEKEENCCNVILDLIIIHVKRLKQTSF